MAEYSARVGQRPKTNITPVASAYVSAVDHANHTVTLVTQNGYPITAYCYSPYPVSESQTVHYVTDTQGNYVVVGSPANTQKTSLFGSVNRVSSPLRNATTTVGAVNFTNVVSDDYGMWNTSTNETFRVPVRGIYSITATIGFDGSVNNSGIRGVFITKNGTENLSVQRVSPQSTTTLTTDPYLNISALAPLSALDDISIRVYSSTSVALVASSVSNFSILYMGNY